MLSFDLSRYHFLQPRLAMIAVWLYFSYSIGFPIMRILLGLDSTAFSIILLNSLPFACLNIYYILVLWKILHVQFRFRQADFLFFLLTIAIIFQPSHILLEAADLISVPLWARILLEFPTPILYMFLLGRISMMKEDLFEEKFFFLFTGFFLSLCQLVNSIGTNLGTEEVSGMAIVLSGLFLLLIFVHLLFLSHIFYSAYKTPNIPADPSEHLIDEIGEENTSL